MQYRAIFHRVEADWENFNISGKRLTVDRRQLTGCAPVNRQPSTVNFLRPTVNGQRSTTPVNCQLLTAQRPSANEFHPILWYTHPGTHFISWAISHQRRVMYTRKRLFCRAVTICRAALAGGATQNCLLPLAILVATKPG